MAAVNLLLRLLSRIYLFAVNLINSHYDRNPAPNFGFPVISVGGIRAGGSGKTPVCDKIIEEIEALGKTPVLFSRGYKRKSQKTEIVAPHEKTSWETVGDEPLMLKSRRKSLWLAIDADRNRAAEKLLRFPIDKKSIVAVMDDGFQCRSFRRDLDIVVLSPNDLNDELLPLGRLREPIKSLERADVIISQMQMPQYKNRQNICVEFSANEFINVKTGEKKNSFDEEILCFCGIARPERFVASVKKLTGKDSNCLIFPDHHKFSSKDYKTLNAVSEAALVTTQKDFVRLNEKKMKTLENVWCLSYDVVIKAESENLLREKIKELLISP